MMRAILELLAKMIILICVVAAMIEMVKRCASIQMGLWQ